jgi:hypothetical protein
LRTTRLSSSVNLGSAFTSELDSAPAGVRSPLLPDPGHNLGAHVRRAVEVAFEMRTGGKQPLGAWLTQQRMRGTSLRELSRLLFEQTGVQVSHETIRAWIREG